MRRKTKVNNTNDKGKGKSGYSKKMNKKDYESAKLDSENRDNNPNHYFVSAELAKQCGQLSFQSVVGQGSIVGAAENSTISIVAMNPCPGISFIHDTAVPWSSSTTLLDMPNIPNDGINLMAAKTYTLLSTFSGRTSTYQPCDVAVAELAMASVSELSEHMRRIFGLALTYNPRNRSMPAHLIECLGVDFDDLQQHISDYRMRFNIAMSRINQVPLLDNVGFIQKARDMYQKVYMDEPSAMGQMFAFVPWSVWTLDEQTYSTGSVLETTRVWKSGGSGTSINTMDELLQKLELMIDRMLTSSTLQVVYADILNLANKMKVSTWQFDYLAENYVVMPEYNPTALLQFHHVTPCNLPVGDTTVQSTNTMDLTSGTSWQLTTYTDYKSGSTTTRVTNNNNVCCDPNTGMVIYNPIGLGTTWAPFAEDAVIDVFSDNPSIEDIIEALRYSVIWSAGDIQYKRGGTNTTATGMFTLGDHYCTRIMNYRNRGSSVDTITTCLGPTTTPGAAIMSKFNKWPIFKTCSSATTGYTEIVLADLNFYTSVDYRYMARVNRLMFEGLFDFRV